VAGGKPVSPASFIIAEAASRMRHNYAVVLGTRAMKKIRPYSLEHEEGGEASPKVSVHPADRLDAGRCLLLEPGGGALWLWLPGIRPIA
jgi:hypothetical protein